MDYLQNIFLAILEGSVVTLQLFFITLIFSIPLGIFISLVQISRFTLLKKIMDIYIWIMRGTPLLLQIFFIYFGLPNLGITLDRFVAAAIAFILNYAAYFAEIFRGGLQSMDRGQYEGAYVLGMNYRQTMIRIIFPQMIKRVLPPVSNEVITLIKDTSLIYAIGLSELLRVAKIAATRDFTITPFVVAAIFYLLFTFLLTVGFKKLEKRLAYYE